MPDLFDHEQTELDMQLAALQSLARITQITLAYLNAVAWMNDPERTRLNKSIQRAVKENAKATKDSLYWALENSKRS